MSGKRSPGRSPEYRQMLLDQGGVEREDGAIILVPKAQEEGPVPRPRTEIEDPAPLWEPGEYFELDDEDADIAGTFEFYCKHGYD